jgi:hypothetical protein
MSHNFTTNLPLCAQTVTHHPISLKKYVMIKSAPINFIFIHKIGSSGLVSVMEKAKTECTICTDNHKFNHFKIFHNKNADEPLLSIFQHPHCDNTTNHTTQTHMLYNQNINTTNKSLV